MKVDKPFLDINSQIDLLIKQGLLIRNIPEAKKILRTHSYYSFVNGYCDLLVKQKSPRVFKDGSSFVELRAIYNFDTSFRRFLFPQLLFVEDKIKATCINKFCGAKVGNILVFKKNSYLKLTSYETFTDKKLEFAKSLIKDFKKAIRSNIKKNNPAFVHSMSKYGYVPFWVLVTNLSFGQISRFYEALTFDIRSQIAKVYKLKDQDLRVVLKILNGVRNLCAHSNRVYCSNLSYVLPEEIGITGHKTKVDVRCSKKFGSTLYCLKYVVSANKFSIVIDELNRQIDYLKHHLHTISIKDVLKKMGISSTMAKEFGIKL